MSGRRRLRPKSLYTPHSGTPPGYRWVTIREDRPDHPLQWRHILVRTDDGTIHQVRGRQARYWTAKLRGRRVALVAPATASREGLRRAREDITLARRLIADERKEQAKGRRETRRLATQEWNTLHRGVPSLVAAVRRLGGLRYSPDYGRREFFQDIPLAAVKRTGDAPDVLAGDLAAYGWDFPDGDALMAALRRRHDPEYDRAAFVEEAVREYDAHAPHEEMIAALREAIRATPRLRRRARADASPA